MKIERISFTESEENQIFDALTERFDLTKSDIYAKGQTITFDLNELVEVETKLELYAEYQAYMEHCSVVNFCINFFTKDGDEIQAVIVETLGECLSDRISEYYSI